MTEKDIEKEEMSEKEIQAYECGVEVPYECKNCGITRYYDVNPAFQDVGKEIPEFVPRAKVDSITIKRLIERSIEKRCYIETCSLIHNYIEDHLKKLIFRKIFNEYSDKPYEHCYYEDFLTQVDKHPIIDKKNNIIKNSNKYLYDKVSIAFIMDLINEKTHDQIKDFNKKRNKLIHRLLKKSDARYTEAIKIVKKGRKIQLREIERKNKEYIKKELKKIDPKKEEINQDKFLNPN